jgi:ribonuclease HII
MGGLEEEGYASGFARIAGLDEVGRGPLAGPVVAAAVVFPRGVSHSEIKDSKLLTPHKRERLAPWIKEHAAAWAVGVVGPGEIDRINILNASLLAMAYAIKQLEPMPDYLLIDGSHQIPLEFLNAEGGRLKAEGERSDSSFIPHPSSLPLQRAIIRGDQLCLSIAAASILAKVARDRMMADYDEIYPQYGFAQHKGYGSPSHLAALRSHGPCPIHRRSFRPVQESAVGHQQSG